MNSNDIRELQAFVVNCYEELNLSHAAIIDRANSEEEAHYIREILFCHRIANNY